MADKDIYLLDPKTGKPIMRNGKKMLLSHFDDDPVDVSGIPDRTDEEIDADIEALGLTEFLPENEGKK